MVNGGLEMWQFQEPEDEDEEKKTPFYTRAWNALTNANFLSADKIVSKITLAIWEFIANVNTKIGGWFQRAENTYWSDLITPLRKAGWVDDKTEEDLHKLTKVSFPMNIATFSLVFISFLATYVKNMIYVTSADLRRKLFSEYNPEDAPPQAIIPAAFITPEKTTEIRQIMLNQGFAEEQIDLMFLSMYRMYDEDTVRSLYYRGALSKDKAYERMRNLGYTNTRIDEMIQGWPVIPGVQDILTMVAREAFEEDIVKEIGLDAESEYLPFETLAKLGLDRDWVIKYWRMHWMQPSIQQGFEMLHRYDPDKEGEKIITPEILDTLFRIVEIPPYWRDKLTKIAYMPFTRVDVRRMHKMGVLSDEALIRAYEEVGFDRTHAEKMADFTIKFNRGGDKDLTKAEVLKGYSEGLIQIQDTKELLINMGYSENEAVYLTTYEEYKKDKNLQDIVLKNTQSRFEGNLLTEQQTIEKLNTLNLSGNHINVLMEKWRINRFEDMKIPSKADLGKFLISEIIDTDRYQEEMFKLGYNSEYTDWYLQLEGIIKKSKKK